MAKPHRTDEEQERFMAKKNMELEMEEIGVYSCQQGGITPTKKEIEATRKFSDEERGVIYECLIKNNNDIDEALVDYNKFSDELTTDGEKRLKPVTKSSLKQFRMRNVDEYCQHIATDIGLSAIMEIAKDGKQEQTRSLAGQYLMNRGFGMPTQRNENVNVNVHTWADVEKERAETIKQLGENGQWYGADDMSTNVDDMSTPDDG